MLFLHLREFGYNKIMESKKSPDISLPPRVTWKEIEKELKQGKWDYLHNMMNRSMFKQVLDQKDESKAVAKALKALRKTDPQNANLEYAEKMLSWMRKYAEMVLKKR